MDLDTWNSVGKVPPGLERSTPPAVPNLHLLPTMRTTTPTILLLLLATSCDMVQVGPVKVPSTEARQPMPQAFHDLSAVDIQGTILPFKELAGHKVIVVNTASECGYTPQYAELEELYQRYKSSGLVIVGFPSNDFGGQEPGTEADIAAFCQKNYGVTFPMMSKVSTKGAGQSPVYAWLTRKELNGALDSEVQWNFQKYLIDEQGRLVTVQPSALSPLDAAITDWLERP